MVNVTKDRKKSEETRRNEAREVTNFLVSSVHAAPNLEWARSDRERERKKKHRTVDI